MDRPRERPHMGLIYIVMCPRHGWCGLPSVTVMGGVAQPQRIWDGMRMPQCHRVAYPGQYQCRVLYMIFDGFTIICIMF